MAMSVMCGALFESLQTCEIYYLSAGKQIYGL
jgi:hypothetical protein